MTRCRSCLPSLPWLLAAALAAGGPARAQAQADAPAPAHASGAAPAPEAGLGVALAADVLRLSREAAAGEAGGARIDVEVGRLDERLRLAPCPRIRPYLPAGTRAWGRIRIGLRCESGPVKWNVYLPVTVKVYARSLVAAAPLAAGTLLEPGHLAEAEVDVAAAASPALTRAAAAVGRALARPLAAGQPLHEADLRARQWFAAGDTVRIVAVGAGYRVSGEGQALSAGVEGQPARVRTESGRIVVVHPVGERQAEVKL